MASKQALDDLVNFFEEDLYRTNYICRCRLVGKFVFENDNQNDKRKWVKISIVNWRTKKQCVIDMSGTVGTAEFTEEPVFSNIKSENDELKNLIFLNVTKILIEDKEYHEMACLPLGNGSKIHAKESLQLGFSDNIILHDFKNVKLEKIPEKLENEFVFEDNDMRYVLIKRYYNQEKAFELCGLRRTASIDTKDKPLIKNIRWKGLTKNITEFKGYSLLGHSNVEFLDKSKIHIAARAIKEIDNSADSLIKLWEKYAKIEMQLVENLQKEIGVIPFENLHMDETNPNLFKCYIKLTDDQKETISNNLDNFKKARLEIDNGTLCAVENIERYTILTVREIEGEQPLVSKQSGTMEYSTRGDEIVNRRRERAIENLRSSTSQLLLNTRLIMESKTDGLLKRESKKKGISKRVLKFLRENFGIQELTEDQKNAIEMGLNTQDVAIIQGPPGTGKTTVIAAICEGLLEQYEKIGKAKDSQDDRCILVTSFQNDTVEHVSSKIFTFGLPSVKVGRQSNYQAEDRIVNRMLSAINDTLTKIQDIQKTNPLFDKLSDIKLVFEKERNIEDVIERIQEIKDLMHESILAQWLKISNSLMLSDKGLDEEIKKLQNILPAEQCILTADLFKNLIRLKKNLGDKFTESDKAQYDKLIINHMLTEKQFEWITHIKNTDYSNQSKLKLEIEGFLNYAVAAAESIQEKIDITKIGRDEFLALTLNTIRDEIKASPDYIRSSLMHYTESIAATNQIAGSIRTGDYNFRNVILEEAARSNPLDIVIPMVRAEDRIIMVGDQKQLPHLLEQEVIDHLEEGTEDHQENDTEEISETLKEKYNISLFEIMFNNAMKTSPKRAITLTTQFRMHPLIGDFVSRNFYDGKLKTFIDSNTRQHRLEIPWLKDKVGVWVDIPIALGEEKKGKSKSRICEAKKIIKILDQLKSDCCSESLSIGVITFYAAQADLIKDEAKKCNILDQEGIAISEWRFTNDGREKLRIGTVDAFQGKEFDIVILSTVRSNALPKDDDHARSIYGFLQLENRLNVAFSRAKRLIIVVGDSGMFSCSLAEKYVPSLYDYYTNFVGKENVCHSL